MNNQELIELYKKAYESGSCDLKSCNKWLKELNLGVKFVAHKNRIIKIEAV